MDKDKKEERGVRLVVEEIPEKEKIREEKTEEVKAPEKITEQASEDPKPEKKVELEAPPEMKGEVKHKKDSFNALWILIPGMIILGLLIGGVFAYVLGLKRLSSAIPQTPPPTITNQTPVPATASPEASPRADLTKFKITVLNGSGIAGEAGRVQGILQNAGFIVSSTGNASTYDFTKTQISVSSSVSADYVKALTTTLAKTYQLADPQTSPTQTDDVTIIVGSSKTQ